MFITVFLKENVRVHKRKGQFKGTGFKLPYGLTRERKNCVCRPEHLMFVITLGATCFCFHQPTMRIIRVHCV